MERELMERVLMPWPTVVGRTVDLVLLVATVAFYHLVALGDEGVGRQATALVVLGLAPGWGIFRALGLTPSTFTLVVAFVGSLLLTMLVSLATVTLFDWQWAGGLALLTVISGASLFTALARERRKPDDDMAASVTIGG